MLAKIFSSSVEGVDGYIVSVEVDLTYGWPTFNIVGLPDAAVKEAKERVVAAIRNSGINLPQRKIAVNLAPASIKKEGPLFDLPIALGILSAAGYVEKLSGEHPDKKEDTGKKILHRFAVVGELALNGNLRPVRGILPMTLALKKKGIKEFIVPRRNGYEAAIVPDIKIIGADSLKEVVGYLNSKIQITPVECEKDFFNNKNNITNGEYDYRDVKGQYHARRALEVAVAGGHNLIMIGPPGSGKTMLARRITTILPELTYDEAIEITKIHSVAGLLPESGIITSRPFRSPHHTISDVALIGGGQIPRPGEVSLAHLGVLFLDELPEFDRNALEALRQPLEDRRVTIARAKGSLTLPASFMLVAAMNPCPCGNYGHPEKECICSAVKIHKYISKISGPLLDRIDIHIEVPALKSSEIVALNNKSSDGNQPAPESSAAIRKRIQEARQTQRERYLNELKDKLSSTGDVKNENDTFAGEKLVNASLTPSLMAKYCHLNSECASLLKSAIEKLTLSARGADKIVKVARTIADLDKSNDIKPHHIAEAISYRALDKFSV